MPVLFLDLDGPMFPEWVIQDHPDNRELPEALRFHPFMSYWRMDPVAVFMLNAMHASSGFELVVSSSWSKFLGKDEVASVFAANGLVVPMHSQWTTPKKLSSDRGHEILFWLDRNKPDDYLILDDPWSGTLLECMAEECLIRRDRLVLVDPTVGISAEDYRKMLGVVQTWGVQ